MPKTCSVCNHPQKVEIDFALHHGDTTRSVGERFGLSKPTITGHRRSGHHRLQTPRRETTPHTAAGLMARIGMNLDDPEKLRDLRLALTTLPMGERRILIEELRRRSGRVAEHVPVSRRVAA